MPLPILLDSLLALRHTFALAFISITTYIYIPLSCYSLHPVAVQMCVGVGAFLDRSLCRLLIPLTLCLARTTLATRVESGKHLCHALLKPENGLNIEEEDYLQTFHSNSASKSKSKRRKKKRQENETGTNRQGEIQTERQKENKNGETHIERIERHAHIERENERIRETHR